MKKVISAVLLLACQYVAGASVIQLSTNEPVMKTFNQVFKNATNIAWKLEKKKTYASFTIGSMPVKACFDHKGNLIQTTRYYKEENLPVFVKLRIKEQYKNWDVFGVTELSAKNILHYTVVLKKDKYMYVITLDNNGNTLAGKTYQTSG